MVTWTRFRLERTSLILIATFCPLVALRAWLLWTRHIPMDHDAFQYMQLEYLFFNEAVHHGRLPQWLPFLTHGAPSNFWIVISQGLLASTVSAAAPLLKHVSFLSYFEAGLLFDEFILALGCTLLAQRCYKSPAAIMFVAASLVYTTITSRQPWYNVHLFYLLPLILYCLDRALKEASPRHLSLAALFGAATTIGNLPYFLPLTVFTVIVFEGAVALFAPYDLLRAVRTLGRGISWVRAAALVAPLCLACAAALYVRNGFAHTIFASERGMHGHVSLSNFLVYGWDTGFAKFNDLLGRYPGGGDRDNTLYAGILVLPFSLVALARVRVGVSYAFGVTAIALALFSAGTFVSTAFYYGVPFGQYYRDIGHAAPLAKLFLTFYAGYGVEEFWAVVHDAGQPPWARRPWRDRIVIFGPVAVLALGLPLLLVQRLFPTPTYRSPDVSSLGYQAILTVELIALFLLILRWRRWAYVLATGVLVLHGADVLWFKTELEYVRVPQVNRSVLDLFEPATYRFPPKRTQDYTTNGRFAALAPAILENGVLPGGGYEPYFYEGHVRGGTLYWTIESFVFLDSAASPFRTDFWEDGIDAFYRAWVPPSKDVHEHLGFPIPDAPAYRKLSGVAFPKLQLFGRIRLLPNDEAVAKALADPAFAGDELFASERDVVRRRVPEGNVILQSGTKTPRATDRLDRGSIVVHSFTFDTLRLQINNGSPSPAVLYYADAWDPGWRAWVNGVSTPVIRTNLGFKSVIVPPGRSGVRFVFGGLGARALTETAPLLSFWVIGGVISLVLLDLAT